MAYLLQAKGDLDGAPVSINVTCSSYKASEEQKQEAAKAILRELADKL